MELVALNTVITASQLNPSIMTQIWLRDHGIVLADELEPSCAYTAEVSQTHAKGFQLVVLPHMLQFSLKPETENSGVLVAQRVGALVAALPDTPYKAIGINFFWSETLPEDSINSLTRAMFFKPGRPPFSFFDVPNARFGSYLSKDFDGFRQKPDIKPTRVTKSGEDAEESRILFSFNFHLELAADSAVAQTQSALSKWDAAMVESKRIVESTMTAEET